MSLKFGLLGLLNYSPMTGYELSKTFNDSLSYFWQAKTSQIYRELNNMEKSGWLSSREKVQTTKPNKRIYSITTDGKEALAKWLCSDIPTEFLPTRSRILLRIFFSAQNSVEENLSMLYSIKEIYQLQCSEMKNAAKHIAHYKSLTNHSDDASYWELTADFGKLYSRMCLEWTENSIKKLEKIKKQGDK